MKVNAEELEQAVFTTLKRQIETAASFNPNGMIRMETAVSKKSEYEQQIEELQDSKRLLYERYLLGEINLATYKAEKAACDELLLLPNAYAAVLAQAKQKHEEQGRRDNSKDAKETIFDADTLTSKLADLLIEQMLVYPDSRIEITYKVKDIF